MTMVIRLTSTVAGGLRRATTYCERTPKTGANESAMTGTFNLARLVVTFRSPRHALTSGPYE